MTCDRGSSEPVADAKSRLRRQLQQARRSLGPDELAAAHRAVAAHVLAGLTPDVRTVAAYEPFATEPASLPLLEAMARSGRRILVPVVRDDRDLDWRQWTDMGGRTTFTPATAGTALGVDAISTADLILVPALAVGPRGERLGRGGGSYDRALPRARARIVALLHRGERDVAVPTDAHDFAVHAVVDPDGWWPRPSDSGGRPLGR